MKPLQVVGLSCRPPFPPLWRGRNELSNEAITRSSSRPRLKTKKGLQTSPELYQTVTLAHGTPGVPLRTIFLSGRLVYPQARGA